jgi:cytochrome c oxidase subunit 3
MWVIVYAITMTFAALTSAMIVRKGASLDWRSFTLPSILYLDTALLLGSSVTLEVARRRVARFMGGIVIPGESPARWLYITLGLGLLFVTGQYMAWAQLRGEGLYLATNPSSSFFYLLTVAHALHILGGIVGLAYVVRKLDKSELRRSTLDAASRYWHFVDILWVYLLLLLWMKL